MPFFAFDLVYHCKLEAFKTILIRPNESSSTTLFKNIWKIKSWFWFANKKENCSGLDDFYFGLIFFVDSMEKRSLSNLMNWCSFRVPEFAFGGNGLSKFGKIRAFQSWNNILYVFHNLQLQYTNFSNIFSKKSKIKSL